MKRNKLLKKMTVFGITSILVTGTTISASALPVNITSILNGSCNTDISKYISGPCNTSNVNDLLSGLLGSNMFGSNNCNTPSLPSLPDCITKPSTPDCTTPSKPNTPSTPDCTTPSKPSTPSKPDCTTPDCTTPSEPDCTVPGTPGCPTPSVPDTDTEICPGGVCVENPDEAVQSEAAKVMELVNAERAKEGLKPLAWVEDLAAAADVRAKETVNKFSHTRPNGQSFSTVYTSKYKMIGENIAKGQKSPEAVMSAWMNSEGHRANIMNEKYTGIGVGLYEVNGYKYWVQLFLA